MTIGEPSGSPQNRPNWLPFKPALTLIETYTPVLEAYWRTTIPSDPPAAYVIAQWINLFRLDAITAGIDAYSRLVAKKDGRDDKGEDSGPEVSTQNAIRYVSGTCWKIKRGDTFENKKFADGTPFPPDWDTLDGDAKRGLIAQHNKGGVQ